MFLLILKCTKRLRWRPCCFKMASHLLWRFSLTMACIVPSGMSCLQCDRAIRYMHEDFLATAKGTSVRDQIDLRNIIEHAYTSYRETSVQLRGVIDPTTLYRVRTEYQSEFRRYWQESRTGSIQWDMIKMVEKGRRILQKHLELFLAEGLCPNKCGLLFQSVMNCSSCQYGLFTCSSETQDCGVHWVEEEEGGQVVLDCFLPWHNLIVGQAEYHYSWNQGSKNFSAEEQFQTLVVTEDSKIVLNLLSLSEEGVYRCLLLDKRGTELTCMHFILTVIPLPTSRKWVIPTPPSLPSSEHRAAGPDRDTLIIILVLLTGLSILASVGIIVGSSCRTRERRQRKREGEQETDMYQDR